jgi:hypothetical protein
LDDLAKKSRPSLAAVTIVELLANLFGFDPLAMMLLIFFDCVLVLASTSMSVPARTCSLALTVFTIVVFLVNFGLAALFVV